jgi:DNA end-binding protein Ku
MPTTCPVHGQIDRTEIVKGYEFEKDKYVVVEQDELDKIKLRSEKTLELTRFVPAESVQDLYLDGAYYMAPDGPLAEEPFRVVRLALEQTGTAGLGKIMLSGRERPVLVRPGGKGFTLHTLHAANEIRVPEPYFEDIKDAAPSKDYLDLAVSLIKQKAGQFDPEEFRDTYQDALLDLVKSKVAGQSPVFVQEEDLPATFNFAEALRQSLDAVGTRKAAAASEAAKPAAAAKPASKPAATDKPAKTKKPPAPSEPAAATVRKQRRKQA